MLLLVMETHAIKFLAHSFCADNNAKGGSELIVSVAKSDNTSCLKQQQVKLLNLQFVDKYDRPYKTVACSTLKTHNISIKTIEFNVQVINFTLTPLKKLLHKHFAA